MTRGYFINGETLISVKGRSDCGISSLTQLGLSPERISVVPQYFHKDIDVDAWGQAPPDVQFMLGVLTVNMTLVNVDMTTMAICQALAQGGAPNALAANNFSSAGIMNRAGTLMGGNAARFVPPNNYVGLNIYSPIGNLPYCFLFSYLKDSLTIPLGTEKSIIQMTWRVIPYTLDPAGIVNGAITGALNYPLWTNTLDN